MMEETQAIYTLGEILKNFYRDGYLLSGDCDGNLTLHRLKGSTDPIARAQWNMDHNFWAIENLMYEHKDPYKTH